jgi:SRSO17 transposase
LIDYVAERFGISDGIGVVDETGFLKKGKHSVGVQRQYSGTAGKIDNCQIGVFVGYISGTTHLLVDRGLYMPRSWIDQTDRCAIASVPATITHQTKAAMAAEMLQRCWQRGLEMRWVTGDEVYGNAGEFRQAISRHGKLYVLAVSSSTSGWTERPPTHQSRRSSRRRLNDEAPAPQTVAQIIAAVAEQSWRRLSLLRGEKGPRRYDWTAVRLVVWENLADGEELWLLARRSIDVPDDIAYYLSNAPTTTPIEDMARVAMQRYGIEQCFEEAKGELGLDHYEVRTWPSWHRHVTLTMMAAAWLATMRASNQKTEPGGRRTQHRRDAPTSGHRASVAIA